jgi:hypothetical protein
MEFDCFVVCQRSALIVHNVVAEVESRWRGWKSMSGEFCGKVVRG